MGQLYLMILISDDSSNYSKISDIRFELLGETSIADNITYIDNGVVFIGSKLGDSQLLKLTDTPNEDGFYVNVLETYTNLGPILDMILVNVEKQGQSQIITCSGGHKNGSLRIIKSGIGINENAIIDLPGVKTIWPLRLAESFLDDHLLVSFFDYTKILSLENEEFEDIEIENFDLTNQSLYAANVSRDLILQITTSSIRLIKLNSQSSTKLVHEWSCHLGSISVACANQKEILVACRNVLFYFVIESKQFKLISSISLDNEVACLDLCEEKKNFNLCAVGLWGDFSIRILSLPNLTELLSENTKCEVIPRSILIDYLDDVPYLFCSFGDGSVISYMIVSSNPVGLNECRKVVLGTQPVILKKFTANDAKNIFACSDRPSVISSTNQKLIYSSVNLKQVEYMCQFSSKMYPECLILLSSGAMKIGTMDNIQKLHIRSLNLNETVRRLCYQPETKSFGLISCRLESTNQSVNALCSNQFAVKHGSMVPLNTETFSKSTDFSTGFIDIQNINSFLILDQNTFECLYSVRLQPNEFALSIISMRFDDSYYVIGCAQMNEDEPEPKQGRLIIFKLSDNKLNYISEHSTKGAPYCMTNLNNKLIVGISNQLKIYEFKDGQLESIASYSDNVFITHIQCKNEFIITCDIMKSCSVLAYREDTRHFELVAKDFKPIWLSSVDIVDDDNFIMCDCFNNIITLGKDRYN